MYRSELLYEYAKNAIPDKSVWPVFVPSYNRPNANLLKRLRKEPEFPIVLCIRKEQKEMYKEYENLCPVILLSDVHDIAETREAILQKATAYHDNIFLFDDDISWLDFMIPSHTKTGKESMRPSRTCFGEYPRGIDILKMWMLLLQYDRQDIALSSIGYKPDNWSIDNKGRPNKYNAGAAIQCVHLNTKLIKDNNIHYKPVNVVGNEDYALQFDIMNSGLKTTIYKDLMYDCPAINSIPGGCENAYNMDATSRYQMYLYFAKQYYGDHPGIKYTHTKRTGFESIKFNWRYWEIK